MKDEVSMNVALSDMVDTVMKLDRENARLREALARIADKIFGIGTHEILDNIEKIKSIAEEALKEGGE